VLKLTELATALKMDKSNLYKIIKKLGIQGIKVRGTNNQWEISFVDSDIEKILEYRRGIPHNLVKSEKGYSITLGVA